ncbi:MAG: class I SAM-dependent methyltransferase [bacterium]|nr:class I SAM-dependent methyltransferase [bacterium]
MVQITACRSCGSGELSVFLELGDLPLSDGLVRREQLGEDEPRYPLDVAFCEGCGLVQILETVPPEELFQNDYPYFSSFSDALLLHSEAHVKERLAELGLGPKSLAVEIASNDGYLLQYYKKAGVPVLGIDPAEGPVREARKKGVDSMCDFFGLELAQRLAAEGRQASVIHANNVLAHVADTNDFVAGVAALLSPSGMAVFEFPYVKDLIDHTEFDTIYHEHLCYFSVTALVPLFRRAGLELFRVERIPIHGGSLRVFVGKGRSVESSVTELLELERREGIDRLDFYRDFSSRVDHLRSELVELIGGLKTSGKRLAAYGAAAKGAIMINYAKIGAETLEWCADKNVHKQGRYMPGVQVEIVPPERVVEDQPDYLLILPWNFKDEIMKQQAEYAARGGKFIIPAPTPTIV